MGKTTIVGIAAAAVLLAGIIVGGVMMFNPPPAPSTVRKAAPPEPDADYKAARSQARSEVPPLLPPPPQKRPAPEEPAPPVADVPQPPPAKPADQAAAGKQQPAPRPQQSGGGKQPLQSPEARDALCRVGFDPAAEAVWLGAINDPGLPAEERKNLIEDLNEDGFPDPRNITPADLPLILSRIALIEELWPSAMDDVNAGAFREAYKDLVNMYFRVAGQ